jgi:hypothetical protein
MRGPRRKVTCLSEEARERISRANAARWQDPAYRAHHTARLAEARKKAGKFGGFKRGHKHSPEVVEKIRLTSQQRWKDPEYRARHLPHLKAAAEKSLAVRTRRLPPKGTPEYRWYEKVRAALGTAAARALPIKSAGTEGAGRP